MATSFLTALGAVPWGTVIDRAPGLIAQASSLLGTLRGKKEPPPALPPANDELAALRDAHAIQSAELATLRADLTQATALIVELSRDQAALIEQVRKLRLWCLAAGGAALLALLGVLALALR
jgi:hypothetical protein